MNFIHFHSFSSRIVEQFRLLCFIQFCHIIFRRVFPPFWSGLAHHHVCTWFLSIGFCFFFSTHSPSAAPIERISWTQCTLLSALQLSAIYFKQIDFVKRVFCLMDKYFTDIITNMLCALEIIWFIYFTYLNIQAKFMTTLSKLYFRTWKLYLLWYENKYSVQQEKRPLISQLLWQLGFPPVKQTIPFKMHFFSFHTEEPTSCSLPEQSIPRQPDGQTQTHSWRFTVPPLRHFKGHSEELIKQDRSGGRDVADVLAERGFMQKNHIFVTSIRSTSFDRSIIGICRRQVLGYIRIPPSLISPKRWIPTDVFLTFFLPTLPCLWEGFFRPSSPTPPSNIYFFHPSRQPLNRPRQVLFSFWFRWSYLAWAYFDNVMLLTYYISCTFLDILSPLSLDVKNTWTLGNLFCRNVRRSRHILLRTERIRVLRGQFARTVTWCDNESWGHLFLLRDARIQTSWFSCSTFIVRATYPFCKL